VEVKSGGASVARYGYDTRNLRVYMSDGQGERRVLLATSRMNAKQMLGAIDDEIAEYGIDGSQLTRYDRDPVLVDTLMGQKNEVGTVHPILDGLGSVQALIDGAGAVRARYSYDVAGVRAPITESVPTPWGYTGRRHDSTAYVYYRSRYLDVGIGRFTQRDPFGFQAGPNLYAYASDNPLNSVDPAGTYPIPPNASYGPNSRANGTSLILGQFMADASVFLLNVERITSGFYYLDQDSCGSYLGLFNKKCSAWKFFDWDSVFVRAWYSNILVDTCASGSLQRKQRQAATSFVPSSPSYFTIAITEPYVDLEWGRPGGDYVMAHELTHVGMYFAPDAQKIAAAPGFGYSGGWGGLVSAATDSYFRASLSEIAAQVVTTLTGGGQSDVDVTKMVPELF
jgi:RHS repeat-associated protein